ncbi:MAG TPA: cupin domain-containing protein [Bradyrhizobium sp.]|nr:cupin domain-containing protein [Bradyrhizobium sp.]
MAMHQNKATAALILATAVMVCTFAAGEPQPVRRTELLKTTLPEMDGKEMQVWMGELSPGAATGKHVHPTPRFVYVVEGAVVLELEGKAPQTFRTGQAFVEMPGERHILRNASTTEPAKALGFQYANQNQPLQTDVP